KWISWPSATCTETTLVGCLFFSLSICMKDLGPDHCALPVRQGRKIECWRCTGRCIANWLNDRCVSHLNFTNSLQSNPCLFALLNCFLSGFHTRTKRSLSAIVSPLPVSRSYTPEIVAGTRIWFAILMAPTCLFVNVVISTHRPPFM